MTMSIFDSLRSVCSASAFAASMKPSTYADGAAPVCFGRVAPRRGVEEVGWIHLVPCTHSRGTIFLKPRFVYFDACRPLRMRDTRLSVACSWPFCATNFEHST